MMQEIATNDCKGRAEHIAPVPKEHCELDLTSFPRAALRGRPQRGQHEFPRSAWELDKFKKRE